MLYVCSVLFALGFLSYLVALYFVGKPDGETYSDIGNALMLTSAVILLLRLSWKRKPGKASGSRPESEKSKPGWEA